MYTHTHIQARVRDLVDMGVDVGDCLPLWRSLDSTLVLPRACTLHPQYVPVSPSLTHSLSLFLSLSLSRARALPPFSLHVRVFVFVCLFLPMVRALNLHHRD